MTEDQLRQLFDDDDSFRLTFADVPNERRLSNRRDLNAFLLLDKLVPGDGRIVATAEHDQIFLCGDLEALAEVITEEQVHDLMRCGVYIEFDSLAMHA